MKTFEYTGFDQQGGSRKGLIEALDVKDAREKLATTGVLANRIAAAGEMKTSWRMGRSDVFSMEDRATVYREFGALLRAGLPMVKSLDMLIESPELGNVRNLLAGVRDEIREGTPLADALSKASRDVSKYETALITVGERSGTLGDVIERIADFLEQQESVKERVKTALIYPAIVLVVAVLVAVAVFGLVLPKTEDFLREMSIDMPAFTEFVIAAGKAIGTWSLPVGLLILGGVFYARRRAARDQSFAQRLDRSLFSIPLFGKAYATLANLRFARTLAVLLRGGVDIIEGMTFAGQATGSAWIQQMTDAAADAVKQGVGLAEAIRGIPPLSGTLPGWIHAGEASGNLEELLMKVSNRYEQRWERSVARATELLVPAIVMLLGAFVLMVAIAILLPITSINQALEF